MKVTLKNNRIISLVLAVILAFSIVPAFADSSSQGATYLAFTSDVHNGTDLGHGTSADVLKNWIKNVSEKLGNVVFDSMAFGGDYAIADAGSDSKYWTYALKFYDVVKDNALIKNNFFVAGNHETNPGKYTNNTNALISQFQKPGNKYYDLEGQYILYSMGATNDDINGTGFESKDITALETFLKQDSTPTDVPIFIISHFPLHKFGSGYWGRSAKNREALIKVLNEAADTHRIFFVWGHNHSQNDPQYDQVYKPNSTIADTVYKFTYVAAGSGSDSNTNQYGGNIKARGLVAAIDKNRNVTLTYYDGNYQAFGTTAINFEVANPEISYYVKYKNGQMIGIETILIQSLDNALNGKFTFDISEKNSYEVKLFFVNDDWTPNQMFLIQ